MSNEFYYKLKNNLEVVFKKVTDVNIAAIYFVVKTGSANEPKGKEGISHFIEHLIFKGNNKLSSKEITDKVESLGGNINAYTSLDETAFYITLPKRNWKKGFSILKEMVFNAEFNEEDVEKERKVILSELNDGKDNPYKLLIEETFKSIFKKHTYRNPVIGFKESILNISFLDLKKFYRQNYNPENMFLTIVGNINEPDIKKELNKLEKIKNRKILIKKDFFVEPEQKKINFNIVKSNVNQYYLNCVFKIKADSLKELIIIQLICSILGEFEHSFLKDRLKDKLKLVTDIGTYIYFTKDYIIFIIHCYFPKNSNLLKVIDSLLNELKNFQQEVITPDILLKAKINFKSDKIFLNESVSGEAKNTIFYHLITGNYKNEVKFYKDVENITENDLKDMYRKYFKINRSNIIILSPENRKLNINLEKISLNQKKYLIPKNKPELIKLDNGIRIVYQKITRLPLISFKLASLGGLKYEDNNKTGLSYFMSKVWIRGSKNYFYREIENKFDFFSGFIDSFSGRNSAGLKGIILKEFFEPAFDIFFDIFRNPLFLRKEVENVRKEIIENIKADKDDIFTESIKFFYNSLFLKNYYGHPIKGYENSIKNIKKKDLIDFYKKIVCSENIVFGLTGDIQNKHLDYLCKNFSQISRKNFNKNLESLVVVDYKQRIFRKNIKKGQAYIITGFITPPVTNSDIVSLKIIRTIIGSHSGRLFHNLREKSGLCYSTFAFMMTGLEAGAFGLFVSTSPENENIVIEKLNESILELKKSGISNDEIKKAVNSIKGSIDNYNQKIANINTNNVFNVLYGLGKDYYREYLNRLNNIKKKDLIEIIEKYFNPDNFIFSIVSPNYQA